LLWIDWVALDKLEFIAVPSDKELDAFFHFGGGFTVKLLYQVGQIGVGI
jgi:hypothetical protein